MTLHLLDDPGVLTQRAQLFLAEHGRRELQGHRGEDGEWYECTDLDGREIPGPEGGFDRLQTFVGHYGGLSFCQERPACTGKHSQTYRFDAVVQSGWALTDSGGWVAEVGDFEGWPLTLDWSSARIGIHIHAPQTWIAHSLVNLVESAALGQSLYLSDDWQKAVLHGKGPGWGVEAEALERLQSELPEVTEASSPWNHWLMDRDVAIHGWRATYEPARRAAAIAWYRSADGRRRIEAVLGPLAEH